MYIKNVFVFFFGHWMPQFCMYFVCILFLYILFFVSLCFFWENFLQLAMKLS